ncbi:hypothetical protein Anapl_07241 [Anas platyrhynchos]|uniref:Uncharacterized protein n=1 Tax=Anas platyrhynchos TaxID=8839 RepID=R0LNW4_ANAPL|nr:hypothetical protein Anapl_07241 [Anas platyrhynchos]
MNKHTLFSAEKDMDSTEELPAEGVKETKDVILYKTTALMEETRLSSRADWYDCVTSLLGCPHKRSGSKCLKPCDDDVAAHCCGLFMAGRKNYFHSELIDTFPVTLLVQERPCSRYITFMLTMKNTAVQPLRCLNEIYVLQSTNQLCLYNTECCAKAEMCRVGKSSSRHPVVQTSLKPQMHNMTRW